MTASFEAGAVPEPGTAPVAVTVHADPVVLEGGVVLATVRTRANRDVVLQGGDVVLSAALAYRYITGGIFGATYTSVARRTLEVSAQALPAPTLLRAGREVEHAVLLQAPAEGLPSTDSELVTIEWTVRARVRYEGRERAEAPPAAILVVSEGLAGRPLALPRVDGAVRLDGVAPRRVHAGTAVTGDVVVARRHVGGVRAVRVELVLVQVVPHGPMLVDDPARSPYVAEKEAETVAVRLPLVGGAAAAPVPAVVGEDLRLPFRLRVPELPAPTLATADFTLRWFVRAVVDRRVAGLPWPLRAEIEVIGSTASAPGA